MIKTPVFYDEKNYTVFDADRMAVCRPFQNKHQRLNEMKDIGQEIAKAINEFYTVKELPEIKKKFFAKGS